MFEKDEALVVFVRILFVFASQQNLFEE